MNKRILIVTHRADVHADLVVERIVAQGERPFRLNLDEFPADFALDLELVHGRWSGQITHLQSNDVLRVAEIGAVWARKTAAFAFVSEDLAPQEKAYASGETEHVLSGLLHALDCYWMSHPSAVRSALWKVEQLQRAARMGFRVPASLVANNAEPVLRFQAGVGGDMVFKTLSSPFLGADQVDADDRISTGIATTRIEGEHDEILDAVRELPCFFQQHIAKRYELRVTIIGDRVFAAKIHSQDNERTRVDYRDFSADVRYEATTLPPQIERRCLAFVHSYGLTFGAIDLIVTPDDEYVFLENNPGGQFLFIEQLVPELRMLDAVAQRLIEGAKSHEVMP
jgi:glutathione synthase/RimK-type ligase-like ATP-grasp enzyme